MVNKRKAEEERGEAVIVFASMGRHYRGPLLVFERARRKESHAWEDDLVRECVRWRRQLEWKIFTLHKSQLRWCWCRSWEAGSIYRQTESEYRRAFEIWTNIEHTHGEALLIIARRPVSDVRSSFENVKEKNSWEWFHSLVGKETGDLIVGHDLAWIGLKLNCWQKIWCLVSKTCEFQTRNLVPWARSFKIRFRSQSSFVCRGRCFLLSLLHGELKSTPLGRLMIRTTIYL